MTTQSEAVPATSVNEHRENTPASRLLDMLAGWSNFVDESNASSGGTTDRSVSSEDIGALYQQAGAKWLDVDESDTVAEDAFVLQFVTDNVVPLLLRRK